MDEHDPLDYNFWPSFADLMLSLVFILILVLFLVTVVISFGTVNLEAVRRSQENMVNSIALSYHVEAQKLTQKDSAEAAYGISISKRPGYDIVIRNEATLQRITFSDHILFRGDDVDLHYEGKQVLAAVGESLLQQLPHIAEIQIQGHADTDRSHRFRSNLELAANRAMAVFTYLQNDVGISPAKHLMSATSFGEFKSARRPDNDANYDYDNLVEDNGSTQLKDQNRRIELLLIYRR